MSDGQQLLPQLRGRHIGIVSTDPMPAGTESQAFSTEQLPTILLFLNVPEALEMLRRFLDRYRMALMLVSICDARTFAADRPQESVKWDDCADDRLAGLEKAYTDAIAALSNDDPAGAKALYEKRMRTLTRLFDKRIGKDVVVRQELVSDILRHADEGFARLALCELIGRFAEDGDRRSLIELLARRCPELLSVSTSLEDEIIVRHPDKLPDGTLLLCDAFDRAINADAKMALAKSLRRGFVFVGIAADHDREFVRRIREWYRAHHDVFVPNLDYSVHLANNRVLNKTEGVLIRKELAAKRAAERKK